MAIISSARWVARRPGPGPTSARACERRGLPRGGGLLRSWRGLQRGRRRTPTPASSWRLLLVGRLVGGRLHGRPRLIQTDHQRLSVGDVDQVAHLHQVEVLRIPGLDGLGLALWPLDGDGPRLLVDTGDGGGDRDLAADGTRW